MAKTTVETGLGEEALKAALLMTQVHGYVVLGIPAEERREIRHGSRTAVFAGAVLPGYELEVIQQTSWADWDEQFHFLFGRKARNPYQDLPGQRFYRCGLFKTSVIPGRAR